MEAKTQTKKQGEMAYTTIHHKVRKKLDISLEDYCVGDAIYNLANNPKSNIYGWCYSSKKYISDFIQIGERTVFRSIETLIEKGLVEKDADTKYLRATAKWYENVVIEKAKNDYDKLSEGMTNRQSLRQTGRGGMTSRQSTYDKVADNNNSNNKIDNNIEQSSKGDISFVSSNWIEQCCADQREHIRLIGNYMKIKKMDFPSKKTAEAELKRNLKTATLLKDYPAERRKKALMAAAKMTSQWTLETILKYLNK